MKEGGEAVIQKRFDVSNHGEKKITKNQKEKKKGGIKTDPTQPIMGFVVRKRFEVE